MNVTAQKKTEDGSVRTVTVEYDFGRDLQDAVERFGAEVVHKNFVASAKITLQALIRRHIDTGSDDATIEKVVAGWKPGLPVERKVKDPTAQIMKAWPNMNEEERKDFLAKLKGLG